MGASMRAADSEPAGGPTSALASTRGSLAGRPFARAAHRSADRAIHASLAAICSAEGAIAVELSGTEAAATGSTLTVSPCSDPVACAVTTVCPVPSGPPLAPKEPNIKKPPTTDTPNTATALDRHDRCSRLI
jgi:hypothetical protein